MNIPVPYSMTDNHGKHATYYPNGTLMSDTERQLWLDYLAELRKPKEVDPDWIVACVIIGGFALYGLYCLFHYWG